MESTMEKPTRKPQCSLLTNKGQRCSFAAIEYYDHQPCCKKHYNYLKSKDDCSICFFPMSLQKKTAKEQVVKLTCGHMFHTDCLSQCSKSECPLCRAPFDPELASKIFNSTIVQPLMKTLFSMKTENVKSAIECFKIVLRSDQITSSPDCVQTLHRILFNSFYSRDFPQLLALFDTISSKVKETGSYDGITIIGRNNQLILY
jgi:hypothetical protein